MAYANDRKVSSSPAADFGVIASPLSDVAEPTTVMAVVVDGSVQTPGGIEVGNWSTGLFNCFDFCVPNCLLASFCFCIPAARIASRLGFNYQTALLAFGGAYVLIMLLSTIDVATGAKTTEKEYYSLFDGTTEPSYSMSAWGYIAMIVSFGLYISLWQLRAKVRERFQIPGSCVEDFFTTWCCHCCSLAQMATHTKTYTPGSCDFGPPDELPGYSSQV